MDLADVAVGDAQDGRPGAATLALAAGKDIKLVSAMLRHSSVKITADIYALVLPEVAAEVAEAVAGMVPRQRPRPARRRARELPVSLWSPQPGANLFHTSAILRRR